MINKFGNAIVLYALIGGPATAHTHTSYNGSKVRPCMDNTDVQ